MSETHIRLPDGVALIDDLHLGREQVIATYVLLGERPALVDPGPASTLDSLEQGLQGLGLRFEDVEALLLTHIHLDHAGATGALLERYPHLQVYVHQRGARHIIDPSKLVASASRLYGDWMDRLWGPILPVPAERVTALGGGEHIDIAGRQLLVCDAPGHASHHLVYADTQDGFVFVGDNAGVRLPGSTYARPTTPPPDIDLEAWGRTLDLLAELAPQALLLTHFGSVWDVDVHLETYRERLLRWAEVVHRGMAEGLSEEQQVARLVTLANAEIEPNTDVNRARYQQAMPVEQGWGGLARYWQKRAEQQGG